MISFVSATSILPMLSRSNKITGYAMRAGSRYLVPAIPIILTLLASCMWPSIVPSLAMLLNVEPQMNWAYLSINSQCHVNMTQVNGGGCHFIISKLEESLQLLLQDHMIVRMCMLGSGRLVLTAEREEILPLHNCYNHDNQHWPHDMNTMTMATIITAETTEIITIKETRTTTMTTMKTMTSVPVMPYQWWCPPKTRLLGFTQNSSTLWVQWRQECVCWVEGKIDIAERSATEARWLQVNSSSRWWDTAQWPDTSD